MGGLSVWHWLIFLAVALLLFGGSGKISSIMGDVAKGIKSFKKGMSEDDETVKKDEPPSRPEDAAEVHRGERREARTDGCGGDQEGWLVAGLAAASGTGLRAVAPAGPERARSVRFERDALG